jgi:hypothetical protein
MVQSRSLTEQQKGVLEDLLSSKLTIREVLKKRQIDRDVYCQWCMEDLFSIAFNNTLALLRLESRLVFARYSSDIAMKMVSLAMEEDSEIARQACMDVINHPDYKEEEESKMDGGNIPEMSPELASKMLDLVANHQDSCNESKQAP